MKRTLSLAAMVITMFTAEQTFASHSYNQGQQQQVSATGEYIIKLNANASILRNISGKNVSLQEQFRAQFGNQIATVRPLLTNATKQAVRNFFQSRQTKRLSAPEEFLERLFVVQIPAAYKPEIYLAKMMSEPDVEYCEPMPERTFFDIPNDPRLNEQYYIQAVKAIEAWAQLPPEASAVIAIVDSGVEYSHEDLEENIFINEGETGLDSAGEDKRANGIDDDGNGFIDDYQGWDFVSSAPGGSDNDPYPGNGHGTHVAGTAGAVVNNGIGIAGVAKQVKLLAVKIGADDPATRSVQNQYDGVLYAATMSADVINCSWGGGSFSQTEQDIIQLVTQMGSLVVAAAGNDFRETASYPAAYRGVVSVAALDNARRRASYSNFHSTVAVAAPGSAIMATYPTNSYRNLQGTSMASPVVAAVAAMVRMKFPDYTPLQVAAHLRATTDPWDTTLAENLRGKLGTGSINAERALGTANARSAVLTDIDIRNSSGDASINLGERCYITLQGINLLRPVQQLQVVLLPSTQYSVERPIASIGELQDNQEFTLQDTSVGLRLRLNDTLPRNTILQVPLLLLDGTDTVGRDIVSVIVNPSYRLFDANNIAITVADEANVGYNDFPDNRQGDGCRYKGGADILFEGAFIAGISAENLSSSARDASGSRAHNSFSNVQPLQRSAALAFTGLQGATEFQDGGMQLDIGSSVQMNIRQYDEPGKQDFIIFDYTLRNIAENSFDSLYMGMYYDWDIGAGGRNNIALYDTQYNFGYMYNAADSTLPFVGMMAYSPGKTEYFFPIDNDGDDVNNPGVYDGFTNEEKWLMISGGIRRFQSNRTDASAAIGIGPFALDSGDTAKASFAIIMSNSLENLRLAVEQLRIAEGLPVSVNDNNNTAQGLSVVPHPARVGELRLQGTSPTAGTMRIAVFSLLGEKVLEYQQFMQQGEFSLGMPNALPAGIYTIAVYYPNGNVQTLKTVITAGR